MERRLSSRVTYLWQYILPVLWCAGLVAKVDCMARAVTGMSPVRVGATVGAADWARLAIVSMGAMFTVWIARHLWYVRVAEGALVASRFRRDVLVPLDAIGGVRQDRLTGVPTTVTLLLTCDVAGVGRRLRFLPPMHLPPAGWHEAREAEEIRNMIGPRPTGAVSEG